MSEPNLASLTVENLKLYAKQHSLKIPAMITRKAEMVQWLEGVAVERKNGITKVKKTPSDVASVKAKYTDLTEFAGQDEPELLHLKKYGWVTMPIPNLKPEVYIASMLRFFAEMCPRFDPLQPKSWIQANMPIMLHGMLQHYSGHTKWMWDLRTLCAPIFSKLWCTPVEDLLASFDGLGVMHTFKQKEYKSYFHVDQGRFTYQLAAIQGIVNLFDCGPKDGGLMLVEKSHNYFGSYMERHPSDGIVWTQVDMEDIEIKKLDVVKVCAPAGHMILFDGRMFHTPSLPTESDRIRMCAYVCFQPRSGATKEELQRRITYYESGEMTGHWCYGPWMYGTGLHPRRYGPDQIEPNTIEIANLTDLQKRFVGY